MMTKFSNAVRNIVYVLECPMRVLTEDAHMKRTTLHDVMHGKYNVRYNTAYRVTKTLCLEADRQIADELRKVENLKRLKAELAEAFDEEYKGGAVNGN